MTQSPAQWTLTPVLLNAKNVHLGTSTMTKLEENDYVQTVDFLLKKTL